MPLRRSRYSARLPSAAVIVSTYQNPKHLERCLAGLACQRHSAFEIVVADDGSGGETAELVRSWQKRLEVPLRHVWQSDRGFRKTRILNKAIAATDAEYLVFIDGDCVVHPGFIGEHVQKALRGAYLNGSLIRLGKELTSRIDLASIESGDAFRVPWLLRQGRHFDRRYLRLALPYKIRTGLNRLSPTKLYWLGSNSSCFRDDAVAVNGFDHRFTYGYEDGDFGNRLENFGLIPATVRWTAIALHLDHPKPWASPQAIARNRDIQTPRTRDGRYWAEEGLRQIAEHPGRPGPPESPHSLHAAAPPVDDWPA